MIFFLQQSTNLWKWQNIRTYYTLDMKKVGRLDSWIIFPFYRIISGSAKTIRENGLHVSQRNCTLIHLCGHFYNTFKLIWQHTAFKSSLPWHISHSYTNSSLFYFSYRLGQPINLITPTLLLCPFTLLCPIIIIYICVKLQNLTITDCTSNHCWHPLGVP